MSVEKLSHESQFSQEKIPFTQICNNVINNIKNGDAFLVWCYLQSKTDNWKVIKQDIKNVYGFGDKKIKKIFSYLNRCKLVQYIQNKGSNGLFERVDIRVLNGSKFDENQQFNLKNNTVEPVAPKAALPEKGTSQNDELLNKDITKQRKRTKDKSYCSSGDERQIEYSFFDHFWSIYPRKQKRKDAERIWKREGYEDIAIQILDDIKIRCQSEWNGKEKHFIPLPTTYLNGERWKDEVLDSITIKKKEGLTVTEAIKFCLN